MERTYKCRIDELGRIVLPRELREELGWQPLNTLLVSIDGNALVLKLPLKGSSNDMPPWGVEFV